MKRIEYRDPSWEFPFVAYVPSNMSDGLPLVIQLHGAGERGEGKDDLALVDVHGFSSVIKDEEVDAVVVMPQCPINEFWAGRVESLYSFVKRVTDHFKADKSRVSLTGLSMGGFGTWFLSMAHPELFAAIAPVCGGGMGWNAARLTMPVWAFHGDADATVDIFHSDEMIRALEKLGRQPKYTVYKGMGHSIQKNAFSMELLNWLISKRI